jgi:hypothetical protein
MIITTSVGLATGAVFDRRRSFKTTALAGLCALGFMACPIASAQAGYFMAQLGDTVTVSSLQNSSGETATISFAGLPSTPLSVYSGPELLSGTFGAASMAFSNVLFYCTDLYHYSAAPAAYAVSYLTSSHQPSGGNDLTTTQINKITTLIAGNYADHSATQLAIWSIEYGSAFSFTGTSAQIASDVATYLSGLDGSAPANVQLYQLQASGVQGFAFVAAVPEPATIAVLGAGLIGMGSVRRRRNAATTNG